MSSDWFIIFLSLCVTLSVFGLICIWNLTLHPWPLTIQESFFFGNAFTSIRFYILFALHSWSWGGRYLHLREQLGRVSDFLFLNVLQYLKNTKRTSYHYTNSYYSGSRAGGICKFTGWLKKYLEMLKMKIIFLFIFSNYYFIEKQNLESYRITKWILFNYFYISCLLFLLIKCKQAELSYLQQRKHLQILCWVLERI